MRRGFDPAFSMEMPKPERGVGHAFVWPTESLTDFTTPVCCISVKSYTRPSGSHSQQQQHGISDRQRQDKRC
jgi:hypothetical protein